MLIGRRNVILSGAAAAAGYPAKSMRAAAGKSLPSEPSSRPAVLDQQVSLSLAYYNAWVFQARTTRGAAQAFLVSSSPGDELLTAADMAAVTAAIQRSVTGLSGVISCQVTEVNPGLTPPWNSGGGPSLVFGDAWTVYGYNVTIQGSGTPSQSWFAYQRTDASAAVQTAFTSLADVTECTKAPRPAVTPAAVLAIQQ